MFVFIYENCESYSIKHDIASWDYFSNICMFTTKIFFNKNHNQFFYEGIFIVNDKN